MHNLEIENFGPLQAVFFHSKAEIEWGNLLDGSNLQILEFKFQNKSIFISAIGKDDSIIVGEKTPTELEKMVKKDLSSEVIWATCLHKEILFFWTLTNSQGYKDAFQIQFGPIQKETKIIQGIVLGSKFHFYTLEEF